MTAAEPLARHQHLPPPAAVHDPVCGMTVDPAKAKYRAEDSGHAYFFCSAKCREKFAAEPARYTPSPLQASGAGARTKAGEVLWTCPMHPQIVRKDPGNCPICGMVLEPMTPAAGDAVSPELRNMTRRFWVGVALAAAAGHRHGRAFRQARSRRPYFP